MPMGLHWFDGTGVGDITGDYTTKYYFWYNDDSATYADTYGALYTWAAVMNGEASSDNNPSGVQGVCPDNWHVPGDTEWKELEMYLGMSQADADNTGWRGTDEGGKLKEAGTTHWNSPNTGATNSSSFTALPGGYRNSNGVFGNLGTHTSFWSSAMYDSYNAWRHRLYYTYSEVDRSNYAEDNGFSVRCVKNSTLPEIIISHTGLTETNLNGALVRMKLINETFYDGTLDKTNFSLNNAPPGTSIDAVSYINTDTATVTLAFDGTDFDVDISNFSITISAVEITGSADLTSNEISIIATVESSENNILTYSFTEQTGTATIDAVNHTVNIEVASGTDVSALIASFTISDSANITVSTTSQVSGVTSNDFTSIVTYTITAEDGTTQDWLVTVSLASALSDENEILEFSFSEQTWPANINNTNHTISIEVEYGTDVTGLIATFTISNLATIEISGTTQISGVTSINFTNPVTYTVTAENDTQQDWVITVSEAVILVISDFPYSEDFESGNGGWYSGGTNSSWQLGNPAGPTIDTTSSGSAAWVTNLAGDYNLNEISYVTSSQFDLSSLNFPKVEFNIWWDAEGFYDGANFQYKQGTGVWKTLGRDEGNDSWYNSSYLYSIEKGFGFDLNNSAGWTGDNEWGYGSDGWVTVDHALTSIDNRSDVSFRIAFASNSSYQNDGIAFDDINIYDDPTGIDNAKVLLSDIQIYPNPNEGKFRLVYNGERVVDLKLQLINLQGQVVLSEQIKAGYRYSKEFELEYLPPGLYYFRLMNKEGVVVKKMVVK